MRLRFTLLVCLWVASVASGQEKVGELAGQVPLLLRVLAYDQNFEARGLGDFVVLVVSDAPLAPARKTLVEALKDLPSQKIKNRTVRFAQADAKDEPSVQQELDRSKAQAVLVMPGTADPVVKAVSEVIQDNQIYGLALDSAMVEHAIPLGVSSVQGKPLIHINEKAAKGVGARFEVSVLKLMKVVGER